MFRRITNLWQDLRHRRRRVWSGGGRTHLELRDIDDARLESLIAEVQKAVEDLPGVSWARYNGGLHRLVVSHAPTTERARIIEAIERIEQAHRVDDRPFPDGRLEHPGDLEPLERTRVTLQGGGEHPAGKISYVNFGSRVREGAFKLPMLPLLGFGPGF